jgi:RHS repeat-associated protein
VNTIGTALGDDIAGSTHPTSAKLYYNRFFDGNDHTHWLVHRQWQEFQGHGMVTETHPTGTKTRYTFIQGTANCTPATTARWSHAAIVNDPCFLSMQRNELLMGRAALVEQLTSTDAKLADTVHTWQVGPVDYTWAPLSGLWRAFRYEGATDSRTYEGTGTPSVKRVEYYYNTSCSWTATLDAYGNLGCVIEKDRGTVVRKTLHAYGANTSAYIVDRNIATSILDSSGRYLAHSQRFYDNNNQALGTIGANGKLTREIQVANMPLSTSITNVQLNGRDHTYSYDTRGNPTQVRSYTGAGWVLFNGSAWTASTPGNGSTARVTTTAYETIFHTFPTQITNPLGHIERAAYDYRMGTLIEIDGPNGANNGDSSLSCASFWSTNTTTVIADDVTCAQYDSFGRMIKLARPGDSAAHPTLLAVYSDTASPFRYTIHQRHTANNADVRTTRMYYDGLGRQIATKVEAQGTAPFQSIATFTRYDGLGQVTHQSQPMYVTEGDQAAFDGYTNWSSLSGVRWTVNAYDALGRVTSVTTPDSQVSRSFYGRDATTGLLVHDTVDANRHRVQRRFDTLGRMTNVLELTGNCATYWGYSCGGAFTATWAVGATTTYAYSPLDLLTTVTDAKANQTTMSYDSLGRKTAMTDPDMGAWSYVYDANGNLTRQTNAKGQRLCFYYDALDRLTGKHNRTDNNCPQPGTSLAASYAYDAGTNGKGRRTSMSTSDGTGTTWTYTVRGQIASAVHTVGGMTGSWTFNWQYDSADRLKQITYPTASSGTETVVYGYDAAWRQQSVCISSGGCYAQAGTFDALNQPTSLTLGNNLRHTFTYSNPMARLSRLQVGTSTALGSIFDRSYGYDNVANVTSITDNQSGGIAAQTYGYDERDRLTRWTLGSTTQTYAYDTIGNLTSKAGVSMTYGANANGTGAGPHQARSIGGVTQTYDANGNLTSGMGRTIAWNNENLPSSVTSNGVTETYGYNADSLRVKKVRSGVTTIYLEGLWEQTSSGTTRRFYSLNGQVVAVRTNAGSTNTVSYLHGDHLGSISVTTTASGTAEPRQEFDPWGTVRSGGVTTTTRNYTGQILDDTGLLFYNARYYDPAIGRFISADTIVPGSNPLTVWPSDAVAGGVWRTNGNGPTDPQQLNRYSYTLNNPLKYTDPTGHCVPGTCALTGAAAGGAVAGPAGAVVGGIVGAVVDLSAVVLGSAAVVSGVAPALASDESPVDSVSGAEGLPTSSEDNGPVIIPHDTERQARRAAERDAGMGRHGPREERVEDYKPGSRSPAGDPGRRRVTENSSDPPGRRRSVEHDRYGHRFPDGSTIPPHYGSRTPGQPTRHHTYPSPHNPQNNR